MYAQLATSSNSFVLMSVQNKLSGYRQIFLLFPNIYVTDCSAANFRYFLLYQFIILDFFCNKNNDGAKQKDDHFSNVKNFLKMIVHKCCAGKLARKIKIRRCNVTVR